MEEEKEKKTSRKKEANDKDDVLVKEIIVERKSGFNYAEVIVIMLISLIIGGMVG